jgi:antitoxin (DNA-binding transcriptional repressor) of toxin-antitoxin stability system
MTVVTVHQAKTNLSRLIESVSQGEDVIIARGPKAVAPIVPIGKVKRKRQPGSLKGKLRIGSEFFEPLAASEPSLLLTREPDAKIRTASAIDPQAAIIESPGRVLDAGRSAELLLGCGTFDESVYRASSPGPVL